MANDLTPSPSFTPRNSAGGTVDTCPSMRVLGLTADKQALRIFPTLGNGPVCNNELLRCTDSDISQKMPTQALCELEASSLILRTIYGSVLPHIECRPSPLDGSFNRTPVGLDDWVRTYWSDMERIHKSQVDPD